MCRRKCGDVGVLCETRRCSCNWQGPSWCSLVTATCSSGVGMVWSSRCCVHQARGVLPAHISSESRAVVHTRLGPTRRSSSSECPEHGLCHHGCCPVLWRSPKTRLCKVPGSEAMAVYDIGNTNAGSSIEIRELQPMREHVKPAEKRVRASLAPDVEWITFTKSDKGNISMDTYNGPVHMDWAERWASFVSILRQGSPPRPQWSLMEWRDDVGTQSEYGRRRQSAQDAYLAEQRSAGQNEAWVVNALKAASHPEWFVLRIVLIDLVPEVWRQVVVPGHATLAEIHDQVICAVMPWQRNYHAYCFHMSRERIFELAGQSPEAAAGDVYFGPVQSTALDMCWAPFCYGPFQDDRKVRLQDVLRASGHAIDYVSDLGDQWRHRLIREKSVESSEATIALLDGFGACPPQDSGGVRQYLEHLTLLRDPNAELAKRAGAAVDRLRPNDMWWEAYNNVRGRPNTALDFDPCYFDKDAARERLSTVVRSAKSLTAEASKNFLFRALSEPFRGQAVRHKQFQPVHSCAVCGISVGLQKCDRCRLAWYCSREHQKQDWPEHRSTCKSHGGATKSAPIFCVDLEGAAAASEAARKRSRAASKEVDASMIRDLAKLVLASASQIRLVKAAALRTFLFPSDNACIQAAKQAGSEYSQTAKLRGGSATLSPPHLTCFAAILRSLVADTSVPEQLKVTARAAIASPALDQARRGLEVGRFNVTLANEENGKVGLMDEANALVFAVDSSGAITECRARWNHRLSDLLGKVDGSSAKAAEEAIQVALGGLLGPALQITTRSPQFSATGKVIGAFCVGQQVSAAPAAAGPAASLATDGMFESGASRKTKGMVMHELRSPLHGIIGLSNTLSHDTSPMQKPLLMINSSADRVLELVSNLMDYWNLADEEAGYEGSPGELVDISSLAKEVVTRAEGMKDKRGKPLKNNKVELARQLDSAVLTGDAMSLTQMLNHLIINALKFTASGTVKVSTMVEEGTKAVIIMVEDTGIGINPDCIDRMFEAFAQEDDSESRKYDGIGLGLAIVRQVVRIHNGTYKVVSTQKKGSVFTITLPSTRPAKGLAKALPASASASSSAPAAAASAAQLVKESVKELVKELVKESEAFAVWDGLAGEERLEGEPTPGCGFAEQEGGVDGVPVGGAYVDANYGSSGGSGPGEERRMEETDVVETEVREMAREDTGRWSDDECDHEDEDVEEPGVAESAGDDGGDGGTVPSGFWTRYPSRREPPWRRAEREGRGDSGSAESSERSGSLGWRSDTAGDVLGSGDDGTVDPEMRFMKRKLSKLLSTFPEGEAGPKVLGRLGCLFERLSFGDPEHFVVHATGGCQGFLDISERVVRINWVCNPKRSGKPWDPIECGDRLALINGRIGYDQAGGLVIVMLKHADPRKSGHVFKTNIGGITSRRARILEVTEIQGGVGGGAVGALAAGYRPKLSVDNNERAIRAASEIAAHDHLWTEPESAEAHFAVLTAGSGTIVAGLDAGTLVTVLRIGWLSNAECMLLDCDSKDATDNVLSLVDEYLGIMGQQGSEKVIDLHAIVPMKRSHWYFVSCSDIFSEPNLGGWTSCQVGQQIPLQGFQRYDGVPDLRDDWTVEEKEHWRGTRINPRAVARLMGFPVSEGEQDLRTMVRLYGRRSAPLEVAWVLGALRDGLDQANGQPRQRMAIKTVLSDARLPDLRGLVGTMSPDWNWWLRIVQDGSSYIVRVEPTAKVDEVVRAHKMMSRDDDMLEARNGQRALGGDERLIECADYGDRKERSRCIWIVTRERSPSRESSQERVMIADALPGGTGEGRVEKVQRKFIQDEFMNCFEKYGDRCGQEFEDGERISDTTIMEWAHFCQIVTGTILGCDAIFEVIDPGASREWVDFPERHELKEDTSYLMQLCVKSHWTLVRLSRNKVNDRWEALVFDADRRKYAGNQGKGMIDSLLEELNGDLYVEDVDWEWLPQQENDFDCGLFMMLHLWQVLAGRNPKKVTQKMASALRRTVKELLEDARRCRPISSGEAELVKDNGKKAKVEVYCEISEPQKKLVKKVKVLEDDFDEDEIMKEIFRVVDNEFSRQFRQPAIQDGKRKYHLQVEGTRVLMMEWDVLPRLQKITFRMVQVLRGGAMEGATDPWLRGKMAEPTQSKLGAGKGGKAKGGTKNEMKEQISLKLREILIQKGVGADDVTTRVDDVITQVGIKKLCKIFEQPEPWPALLAEVKSRPNLRLLSLEELKKKVPKDNWKKQEGMDGWEPSKAGKKAEEVDVRSIYHIPEGMLTADGRPLPALGLSEFKRNAHGVLLMTKSEAQERLQDTGLMSVDALVILTIGLCETGHSCPGVSFEHRGFELIHAVTGGSVSVKGTVINLGETKAAVSAPVHDVHMEPTPSKIVRVTIFKNQWEEVGGDWRDVVSRPIQACIGPVVEIWARTYTNVRGERTNPGVAYKFHCKLRIVHDVFSDTLEAGSQRGAHVEPVMESGRSDGDYTVIWQRGSAQQVKRKALDVEGKVTVAFNGSTYGLRCKLECALALKKQLFPGKDEAELLVACKRWKMGPFPYNFTRADVGVFLNKVGWTARPLTGIGRGIWTVGSGPEGPPAGLSLNGETIAVQPEDEKFEKRRGMNIAASHLTTGSWENWNAGRHNGRQEEKKGGGDEDVNMAIKAETGPGPVQQKLQHMEDVMTRKVQEAIQNGSDVKSQKSDQRMDGLELKLDQIAKHMDSNGATEAYNRMAEQQRTFEERITAMTQDCRNEQSGLQGAVREVQAHVVQLGGMEARIEDKLLMAIQASQNATPGRAVVKEASAVSVGGNSGIEKRSDGRTGMVARKIGGRNGGGRLLGSGRSVRLVYLVAFILHAAMGVGEAGNMGLRSGEEREVRVAVGFDGVAGGRAGAPQGDDVGTKHDDLKNKDAGRTGESRLPKGVRSGEPCCAGCGGVLGGRAAAGGYYVMESGALGVWRRGRDEMRAGGPGTDGRDRAEAGSNGCDHFDEECEERLERFWALVELT
ncbi:unnamed protein product [Polarella glacialis]|uniref:histidine kinase n=2 Tax=Polarella glacialis TaxID=89957 RepID=A0A813FUH3_POLGL|nr:unnamed protein product [Polarella glacialis]